MRLTDRRLLRLAMKAKGIRSGSELARLAGLSHQMVNHLLRGAPTGRDTCSIETAEAIERALGVDRGDIFTAQLCEVAGCNGQESETAA